MKNDNLKASSLFWQRLVKTLLLLIQSPLWSSSHQSLPPFAGQPDNPSEAPPSASQLFYELTDEERKWLQKADMILKGNIMSDNPHQILDELLILWGKMLANLKITHTPTLPRKASYRKWIKKQPVQLLKTQDQLMYLQHQLGVLILSQNIVTTQKIEKRAPWNQLIRNPKWMQSPLKTDWDKGTLFCERLLDLTELPPDTLVSNVFILKTFVKWKECIQNWIKKSGSPSLPKTSTDASGKPVE